MTDESASSTDEIRETVRQIDELMALRNRHLASYERLLLHRMSAGEISLLNLASRKSRVIFVMRERALLQMQCKILRRNLFYLRQRREALLKELHKRGVGLEDAVSSPPTEASGGTDNLIDSLLDAREPSEPAVDASVAAGEEESGPVLNGAA